MARDSRYDILFESVKIGPVEAKNRFYSVPHAAGMGDKAPHASAAFRSMKAEGGWGTVCVEMTEIDACADIQPFIMPKILDDTDIAQHQRLVEGIKQYDALAGVELALSGLVGNNLVSREVPQGPTARPVMEYHPVQAKAMSKKDILKALHSQRQAALRAKQAGYDIVYVYAAHTYGLPQQFLSRRFNSRTDEYGGSLENRARLLKEMIEVTKDAVGDRCAVAVRFGIDELVGEAGICARHDGREVLEYLGELPDLWDVNLADWSNDSVSSRFSSEGFQNDYISEVKQLTSKPVVGVGRFTSPDSMVSAVKKGLLDFVGGARPSIADPFLPNKVNENRLDEIRECIGCNICVSGDLIGVPIRCTQNPTIGEEWRKGWHPEKLPAKTSDDNVLVVGAGPTGLEAAYALAKRGYDVTLAEAGTELGGRVHLESQLPGLSEWVRVKDYRELLLKQMPNVEIYRDSQLDAESVLNFGFQHVFIATGAHWRRDGCGRFHHTAIAGNDSQHIYTPDDIMAGASVEGPVIVYDDDHYYMGGVIAEKLAREGKQVTLVTPAALVSIWTENTMEQHRIQARLMELGVKLVTQHAIHHMNGDRVELHCTLTDRPQTIAAQSVVMVTARTPNDGLYQAVSTAEDSFADRGIASVAYGGDCEAPSTIAAAVYAGHRYAMELGEPPQVVPFRREFIIASAR